MYSLRDRLRDWANQKGAWTHIGLAVGIGLIIMVIVLAIAMPSKSVVDANAAAVKAQQGINSAFTDALTGKASQAELDSWAGNISDVLGSQAAGISGLTTRVGSAETKITSARNDIVAILGNLTGLENSPPEAHLAGTFGNYTLHAKSNEVGNFTAKVHLVFSPIIGNATTYIKALDDFYAGVNWTAVNVTVPTYFPMAAFNGTTWGIGELWWDVGAFALTANNEVAINITCAGLNVTWAPTLAYVEIYPL